MSNKLSDRYFAKNIQRFLFFSLYFFRLRRYRIHFLKDYHLSNKISTICSFRSLCQLSENSNSRGRFCSLRGQRDRWSELCVIIIMFCMILFRIDFSYRWTYYADTGNRFWLSWICVVKNLTKVRLKTWKGVWGPLASLGTANALVITLQLKSVGALPASVQRLQQQGHIYTPTREMKIQQ